MSENCNVNALTVLCVDVDAESSGMARVTICVTYVIAGLHTAVSGAILCQKLIFNTLDAKYSLFALLKYF
jgi:hypothetical protein